MKDPNLGCDSAVCADAIGDACGIDFEREHLPWSRIDCFDSFILRCLPVRLIRFEQGLKLVATWAGSPPGIFVAFSGLFLLVLLF